MISILVCSRIGGNKNYSLLKLLDSLQRMSANYDNFEVIVKFDSEDKNVNKVLHRLSAYPFTVKYIIEPRGRGYVDLHVFYNRLFSLVDERSIVVGAVGDDFEVIQERWDEVILGKTEEYPDQIFIIHGRPHPPKAREDYQERKFYLDFDINDLENSYIIDEAPLWGRKLLDICGGFGHLSFTDVWTLILEYYLFHVCGLNRTIFLDQPFTHRRLNPEVDKIYSARWWTDRANNFALTRSGFYKTQVEHQALNIYATIKMSELSLIPQSLVTKGSDFIPRSLSQKQIEGLKKTVSCINLKRKVMNLVPISMHSHMSRYFQKLYPLLNSIPLLKRFAKNYENIILDLQTLYPHNSESERPRNGSKK